MKQPVKIYATALAELLLKATDSDESQKIADGFLVLLVKNGDFKKAKDILALAEKIYLKKTGNKKIEFETARPINEKSKELLFKIVKKGDITREKINPKIISGVKITINNEKQFDASIASKIKKIF